MTPYKQMLTYYSKSQWHSSREISQGISQPALTKINLKIDHVKFHPDLLGVNELMPKYARADARIGPMMATSESSSFTHILQEYFSVFLEKLAIAPWQQIPQRMLIDGSIIRLHKSYSEKIFVNTCYSLATGRS